MRRRSRTRENNEIVEKRIKKLRKENNKIVKRRGVSKTLLAV